MKIKNRREHHITTVQMEKFDQALSDITQTGQPDDAHPLLYTAQINALQSQRDSLHQELTEYETVKAETEQMQSGRTAFDRLKRLLPRTERITLTDEDLASVVLDSPE